MGTRFLPILRKTNAILTSVLFHSSPQRSNNPYAQFDDRNYEMSNVQSTTNLTAGLSGGGGGESMSEFYDEVTAHFFIWRPPLVTMGLRRPQIPLVQAVRPH